MEAFIVNGKNTNFADVIIANKESAETVSIMTFGYGVKQVSRILNIFGQVLLIADESHAKLNEKAYNSVLEMESRIESFTFKQIKNHAKIAIIDNKKIIFTSANLSSNHRCESYLIGALNEINGIDEIKRVLHNTSSLFRKKNIDVTDAELFDFDKLDINNDS